VRRNVLFLALAALITALLCPIATGATSASATSGPPSVGWWAGQNVGLCGADPLSCPRDNSNYTPQAWDALAAGNGFLNFDLVYHSDFGPAMAGVSQRTDALPIIREANRRGIPVNAWITVPLAKGTFANENNATEVEAAVQDFVAWASAQGLTFGQAIIDQEFPAGYQSVYDALLHGDLSGFKAMASGNLDPSHQCAAARTYADTITWAHQHGVKLSGTPVFFALDDLNNGSTALQDAMDITAFPPSGFDTQYLQAYRADGIDLGSGMVAQYFTEMQQRFGDRGQVSLGNTGTPPYTTVDPVVADVRMLAGMGAREIPIFDFDSTVKTYGVAGLSAILDAANHPMSGAELAAAEAAITPFGTAARAAFAAADAYATAATGPATLLAGHPQVPNAYPNGCTGVSATPLG
jgi:hypothetical protein